MLRRVQETQFADRFKGLKGKTVYGRDNEKIGRLDDLLVDPDNRAGYAIIDSGGWLRSRHFVVPLDYLGSSQQHDDALEAPVTKQHIESLPEWDPQYLEGSKFSLYEGTYRTRWDALGLQPRQTRAFSFDDVSERDRLRTPATSTVVRTKAVYGVYLDQPKLEAAVQRLKDAGFQSSEISVVFPDKRQASQFAVEHNTKAPEGAVTGGGTGIVVGGVLGWLAGIGSLAIPGVGPLIAAGPIVSALAGAGLGGAVGGLAGGLIGMGVPEIEAKRYEREVKEGRMLLSVRCDDPRYAASARSILQETGARDIFQAGERLAA